MAEAVVLYGDNDPQAKRKLIIHAIGGEPPRFTIIATDATTGKSVSVTLGKEYFKEEVAGLK